MSTLTYGIMNMAKNASTVETSPDSGITAQARQARKPRTRTAARATVEAPPRRSLAKQSTSTVTPILIGLGVGAALAAGAIVLGASSQRRSRSYASRQPTLSGALAKAALVALTRIVVQRAVTAAANKATLKLAEAWPT